MLGNKRKRAAPFMKAAAPFNAAVGHYAPLEDSSYEWPRIVLAYVRDECDDYLICNCYTDDTISSADASAFKSHPAPFDGRDFAVAKPSILQRTPWDGQQVTYPGFSSLDGDGEIVVAYSYLDIGLRTASDVNGEIADERQRITPDYFVGDVICIARGRIVSGDWTGITRSDSLDEAADDSPIEWIDMNCGGRAWAVWEG